MKIRLIGITIGCVIAGGQLFSSALGATRAALLSVNTAESCQLSLPTIDSKIRPRATSYNNEGTTSVFVICGYTNPDVNSGDLTQINLGVRSLNGKANSITCTGVNGVAGYSTQTYVSKTLTVPATGYSYFGWYPVDFGGTTGIPLSYALSVTCNLPPNVGFNFAQADYNLEIGS